MIKFSKALELAIELTLSDIILNKFEVAAERYHVKVDYICHRLLQTFFIRNFGSLCYKNLKLQQPEGEKE